MMNASVSPAVARTAQVLLLLATATFIGVRFLPPKYRQRVGITLTVCYATAIISFAIYIVVG
jgi:hypothetical protein